MAKHETKHFRGKVIKIFILITILPLLIVSISNLYLVIITRQKNISEYQHLALDNAGEKVLNYIDEKSDGLNLIISSPIGSLHSLLAKDTLFLLINSFETSRPNNLDFIDKQGNLMARIDKNRNIAFNRLYIDELTSREEVGGETDNFIKENNIGTISVVEGNVFGIPDYKTAIAGEQYIGSQEFVNDKPVIRMASPIKNEKDEIIGAASAEVSLDNVDNIIKQMKLGGEGYFYLVDNNGRVVGSSNDKLVKIASNLINVQFVNKLIKGEYVEKENLNNFNITEKNTIIAGKKIDKINWSIVSEWPIKDAFDVIGNIMLLSVIVTVVVLMLIVVLGIIFTRQIIKPINTLSRGAKEISQGNLDYKISLETGDEFEMLGSKFNEMVKVLKENRKLRDEFVFIAAHELRTPVTAIKGYLSMVLEETFGPVPPDIKKNLDIVNSSNERLVRLVQDLLEVARSEAGKMKITKKELLIASNVETVVNELKSLSDKKGIKIIYEKPDKKAAVQADEFKLKEVLTNIIGNAIKYTLKNGDIKIWHEKQDGFLVTHIKDHGIGMTKEQMEKLFSKFYRIQTEQTTEIEGTGLGLFICKEIMERMEGDIWAESEAGQGSTFCFKLKIVNNG
ncbi:hypothetical protein DRH27_00805 [Candidatus Falkowbacteria bacterium]|nr:MAG: hypothetical protein DRH27_00805 [Candidatus Falkowbacteria bacterium]